VAKYSETTAWRIFLARPPMSTPLIYRDTARPAMPEERGAAIVLR
jgi:hypothetical protein